MSSLSTLYQPRDVNLNIDELVKRYPEISRLRLARMKLEAFEIMKINNPNEYQPQPQP
jgi:hypothetical protein